MLGVTGSIACYKAVDLCSKLVQAGAKVDVILTKSAQEFVSPLTFRSISHRAVVTELFDAESKLSVEHVALAERAEVVVVAPATANTIAKMALGLADDALSATVLATRAPLVIGAGNGRQHVPQPCRAGEPVQAEDRGAAIVGPAEGRLASGLIGKGRLAEVPEILGRIAAVLGGKGDLAGRRVVVTAGGTREAIDPVRVLTNRSSGKMGYAIAEAARDRGALPLLITAPTGLPNPAAVEVQKVESAQDMCDAVVSACESSDVVIMAAAVADYRAASPAEQKIKKGAAESSSIQLARNPDILAEVNGVKVKVGFAAETEDLLSNARSKLQSKGADLFVANDVSEGQGIFGSDTNKVTILDAAGGVEDLPRMTKYQVAHRILDRVVDLLKEKSPQA